jgi:hypothetical protein
MIEHPEDWQSPGREPASQGPLQEAVQAFLRSPLPRSAAGPAGPWVPQITDLEEPTVLDAVVADDDETRLDYMGPEDARISVVAVPLSDGTYATAIHQGLQPDADRPLSLPETLAQRLAPDCRVRFFGRWANVHLMPSEDDWWPSGRMFVVERYELPA